MNCCQYQALSKILSLLSFTMILCILFPGAVKGSENPLLLLISFDGFRWDYLDLVKKNGSYTTPNFDYFLKNGVTIDNGGVKNAFITVTFPNHYTIVTGMYEENHGVVGNSMYDPKFNKSSSIKRGLPKDAFWFNNGTNVTSDGAEPIWITNQKSSQPKILRETGVYFWPGSEVAIQGMRPKYYIPYNKSIPFETRVDTVIGWFKNNLINLGLLYFNEPDSTGHKYGPNSIQILQMVSYLDTVLGRLRSGLERIHLLGKLNIIITSDHGMTTVYPHQYIEINKLSPLDNYKIVGDGAVSNIFPKKGMTKVIYDALSKGKHLTVYLKEDIPRHYQYRFNRRIGPIVAVADEGWYITTNISEEKPNRTLGDHGYNNSLSDMHPIFIASGPVFKVKTTVKQFHNVDIYPLICHILNVKAARNDGSLDNIKEVLKRVPGQNVISLTMIVAVSAVCFLAVIACIAVYCFCHRKKTKKQTHLYVVDKQTVKLDKDGKVASRLLGDHDEDDEIA